MRRCFAIGCKISVPTNKFGCFRHWNLLPPYLRDEVWDAYRSGDRDRTLELALDAMEYVKKAEK